MRNEIINHISKENPWRDKNQFFETITSTNDVLKQMALQGAPEGTVLVADSQSGGRGRLGRTFLSPSGVGIYLSVLLRPACMPGELMHLTCGSALAACNAIEQTAGFRPGVKWTNDIVYRKKKLAGILTELGLNQDGSTAYAIIGIGINVNQTPEDFPEELRDTAGSLAMAVGHPLSRAALAAAMIRSLDRLIACWPIAKERYLEAYRRGCRTPGQAVNVITGAGSRPAEALAVNDDFSLRVRYEDGTVEDLQSGEVSIRPVK